ncbi:MAG: EamA family transporter [Rudaea sp.]
MSCETLSMPLADARTQPFWKMPVFLGGAFVLLWCTGYPVGKIALAHAAPFTLLVARFGIAGMIYLALALAARQPLPRGRDAIGSALVGVFSLALQFGGVYLAIALGASAGMAALIIGIMPIATALIGLTLGETIRPMQWAGFALGVSGVAFVVADRLGGNPVGVGAYVALVVGLAGISIGTVVQKRLGSVIDLRSGLAIQNLVATLLLLPIAWHEGFRSDGSTAFVLSIGWLVVINSLAGFALLFLLLKRGATAEVAALFFLMPPVTAVLNYFVVGEALTAMKIAGFALAAFGVYLGTHAAATNSARATSRSTRA